MISYSTRLVWINLKFGLKQLEAQRRAGTVTGLSCYKLLFQNIILRTVTKRHKNSRRQYIIFERLIRTYAAAANDIHLVLQRRSLELFGTSEEQFP